MVLFAEGDGDVAALPFLVKKIASDLGLWGKFRLVERPFRIGELGSIGRNQSSKLARLLESALKRGNVGAILAVIDGDAEKWNGRPFCAANAARALAERAKETGAGKTYSFGFVFACIEYETWLLAGIESLAGQNFPDGRPGVRVNTGEIPGDLEAAPRGAKEELGRFMPNGYKPSLDQLELTKLLDLNKVRQRNLRSFARLETAICQLAEACQSGQHISTPPTI